LLVFRVYDQSVKKLHAYSLPYDFDFLYYYSTDTLLGIALSQPGVFLLNLTGKKLTFKVLQGTGIYNFSSLCKYGTDLIGASGNGIYRIDFKGHVRQLSRELNQVFYKQAIWKIKSSGGKLWFLSDYTIASYDTVTGQIEVYPLVTYVNRYNGGFTLIGDTMIISNYYNVILAKIADLKRFFSHVKEHPDISYVQVGDLRIYGVSPNSLFFKVNDTTWNLDFKIPYNSSITVKVGLISPVYNQLIFEYKINKGHWERFNPQTPLIISQLPFGNNYLHIRIHSFVTGKNYKILVHLRVRLPFYLRPLAFVFYGIILVIIMLIISYLRSNKFKRQRDIFRKLIERKTHELVHKNKLLQEQYKQLNEMTELLKMQKEELEVQNERLRLTNLELKQLSLVAQKTNNSVLILDEKGKVEWWNTGFAKLFKFKFNLGDSSVTELVKNIRPDVYQRIQNFPKDKPFITYTTREIISELGKELWYTTTITPVYDEQGRLFRFVVLDVDITELKMAEKQIKNQRDKLKHQTEILKRINEELVESKRSLELQNKEILSSLWYAKRIQNALLPYDLFKELFPNSFIFSRAKEIVSGDFFYVTIKGDFVILAIADGTGHGVPGAFMSVLGITLLKDAIERYQNNPMPHFILNTLRDFIIKALNQNFQDVSIKDGLDIALSVVEPMEKKVYFAGANIPLNIVRNNEVLIELRGDRMPIGLYDLANVSFTLHSLNIRSGDKLYLYTDGYVDQFGGPNNKRYKRSKFRKLMIEISSLSMEEQKQKLEDELDRWMHNNDQVDDILVIGLELDLDYLITKVQFHEE
jgi:PAS domain S-box-containing protein